ncbi:MAG: hypothetical protein IK095_06140 [Oscillospiraceae bacterium]|nr:hypothetical protein [Oscillospiraceae bacterium]
MGGWIRQLCLLSIFCGAAQSLAPEGSGKRMLSLACSVVLLVCAVGGLRSVDLSSLQTEARSYREQEERFLQESEKLRESAQQSVIARACETYIWDKARELGLELEQVEVSVCLRDDGTWLPQRVTIRSKYAPEELQQLCDAIDDAFGSPEQHQERGDDGVD